MTVPELKKQYIAIKKEAAEIEAELKPLFKKLRSLVKRATNLGNKADTDNGLYIRLPDGSDYTNGWNISLSFRLADFSFVSDEMEGIETVLSNIRHTPFKKMRIAR